MVHPQDQFTLNTPHMHRAVPFPNPRTSCDGVVFPTEGVEDARKPQPSFGGQPTSLFRTHPHVEKTNSFEALWNTYAPALRRAAYRIVQNPSDLDDILQSTMFKAYTHWDGFRGEASLRTWLTSIALNEARQHRRRCRSRREVALGSSTELLVQGEAKKRYELTRQAGATQEMLAVLHAQITKLPTPYQVVLRLRYVEEASGEEIARQLGLSVSAAKSRLLRGQRLLRDVLERKRVHSRRNL